MRRGIPSIKYNFDICHIRPYAILIIALLASAVGKATVKSPLVDVLSAPKSNTTTALLADPAVVEEL